MSDRKPAEVVETFWVIKGQLGSQGLDIQGFIASVMVSRGCCVAWVHRVPIMVFTRVILGFDVWGFFPYR